MLLFRRVHIPGAPGQHCDERDFCLFNVGSFIRLYLVGFRVSHARLGSLSQSVMKKKQKGKATIEDQDDELSFQGQDGGDLFGDLAAETSKTTKPPPPISSTHKEAEKTEIRPTAAAYSPEKKVQFEDLLSRLENRVGKSLEHTTADR